MSVVSRFAAVCAAAALLAGLAAMLASPAEAEPRCPSGYYWTLGEYCYPYGPNGEIGYPNIGYMANLGNVGQPVHSIVPPSYGYPNLGANLGRPAYVSSPIANWGPNWGPPPRPWAGWYVGGGIGVVWVNGTWTAVDVTSLSTGDPLIDAIKRGRADDIAEDVYWGYLWDYGDWVAGAEADWAYYNALLDPGIPGTGGLPGNRSADSVTMRAKWAFSLRGRLGYLVTPFTQVFVAVGPSWLRENATVNCTAAGVCGTNGIPAFTQTNSTTRLGLTVGTGVETKIIGNWRGRMEYRYSDYGTWRTTFGTPSLLSTTADIHVNTHQLLFSVAYGF
jgi:opacity protein-like surface antigen